MLAAILERPDAAGQKLPRLRVRQLGVIPDACEYGPGCADPGLVMHAVRVVICRPALLGQSQILGALREPIGVGAQ
jgi:hypothetical protein